MSDFITAFPEFRATVDVYAPASSSGGTAGTPTLAAGTVLMLIFPVTNQGAAGLPVSAPEGIAGARIDLLGVHAGTTTIGRGYQVKKGTITYIVEGTADWSMGQVLGLQLPA